MTVIAYHFTGDTLRDGRPVPKAGETLVHEGPIEICCSGLHASKKPSDALNYAPGRMLHMVECDGIECEHDDKFVCRERTIIKSLDATYLLRRFAADRALSVAHLWKMPAIVREYLTTLDEDKMDAARAAARAAASAAASAAAWSAEWDATRSATWSAEWAEFNAMVRNEFAKI